jgi:hypothetical protein
MRRISSVLLRRPPSIQWPLRRPFIWWPRNGPPASYPINTYAIDDYVLCLLLRLFMHSSDDFYDDEYDFYVCHKIAPNSGGGC